MFLRGRSSQQRMPSKLAPNSVDISFISRGDLLFREAFFLIFGCCEYDVLMCMGVLVIKVSSNAIEHDGLPIELINIILPCILGTHIRTHTHYKSL